MESDVLVALGVSFTFGWIVWSFFSTIRRYKIAKLQAGVQSKLLDKFVSGQELVSYMQTEAGKQLLDSLAVEQSTPYGRILSALQAGVILGLLGAALLFLRSRVGGSYEAFLVLGTLVLTLGIGFTLSAVTSYVLSKSLGLLNGTRRPRQ